MKQQSDLLHYLSVQQPYPWMIDNEEKDLEMRSYKHYHRGPLVILASKKPRDPWPRGVPKTAPRGQYVYGVAVCLVDMLDCRPMGPEDWKRVGLRAPCPIEGQWVWQLKKLGSLPPIPQVGRVFLFQARNQEINRHVAVIRGAAQPST